MNIPSERSSWLFLGIVFGLVGAFYLGETAVFDRPPMPALPAVTTSPVGKVKAANCASSFPIGPRVAAALREGRPIRIGVFGDSFGDGLWAAARTEFDRNPDFDVIRFSKPATGFTTYHISDRLEDARIRLETEPVDVALVSFGANDAQGIMIEDRVAPYLSPGWKQVIGGRTNAFVELLQDKGIAVAWVGLPGMRSPAFDRKMHRLKEFFQELMCHHQVEFLDTAPMTEGPGHHYSKDLINQTTGKSFIARADDGIHMSLDGYRFIARPLFAKIKELKKAQTSLSTGPRP